jgi:molybdopterin synthase sulfur carrier subunit
MLTRGAPWAEAFTEIKRIRAAVAHEMANDDARLAEGAEVAFFPPVTGG